MVVQLNLFMALFILCGLLTQPATAAPDGYQTLIVDGYILTVQMTESLPTDALPLAASDDSLSIQKRVMRAGETEKVGSVQAASTVSYSTEQKKRKRTIDRLALFGISVIGGTLIGAELGPVLLKEPEDCPDDSFLECDLRDIEGGFLGFLAGCCIGIILASDLAMTTDFGLKGRANPLKGRVSVSLGPDPKGGLSAIATLRF